jgi:hypothetical protein
MWTDITGQHQVEARLLSVSDGMVYLQKANGRYLRVPLDKLCDADQQVVHQVETLATNW